jgi:hypothetical protein
MGASKETQMDAATYTEGLAKFAEQRETRRWNRALKEFNKLEAVDDDPARMHTVADLVFIAQFEIDLVEAGESEVDVRPHRKFVKKWQA